ncbi:hypothetical protein ACH4F6_27090 [Streptomyces sp. NPDC017936]|uniref:hypothetical protein n=1 Tax=Streptomyces sp. NPDC017936 TaxID=3365016 RepID=UPI0037B1E8A6
MSDENLCKRRGCNFHAEILMIGDLALPTSYCGDSCADFEWLRRGLEAQEPTPEVASAFQTLNALERLLNGRSDPFAVGPLLGSLYGRC